MIFIKSNVPSSKNNKVWTGRHLVWSKRALAYKKETKDQFLENKELFLSMLKDHREPYAIGFHFVRNNRHKFDFVNMVQTVQDLMVEYGYLEDDNTSIMLPFPFKIDDKYYSINTENPGVYITILNDEI